MYQYIISQEILFFINQDKFVLYKKKKNIIHKFVFHTAEKQHAKSLALRV